MKNRIPSICAVLLFLSACSGSPPIRDLALYDEKSTEQQQALMLPFESYIIGIEKDNASRVGSLAECKHGHRSDSCLDIDAAYFSERPDLREQLREKYYGQHRPTYISHVARFDGRGGLCFLYNVYTPLRPCKVRFERAPEQSLVSSSWKAMSILGDDVGEAISTSRPTHVIVYTMGWNTLQPEALSNFRDLVAQLTLAAQGSATFHPLVIGITWPSTGQPMLDGSDYGIKAKDADEVGAVWANLLLNRELRRLKAQHPFKVVVVGHSFGARLSSRAVFSAPLVGSVQDKVVDLLVGLQGAYSFQRYLGPQADDKGYGTEGAPYRHFADQVGMVALTASRHDTAVTAAGHAPYFVGSAEAFERTKGQPVASKFLHATLNENGTLQNVACDSTRVLYIDSSAVIKGNKAGTGGGAHSMIYTPEIGRLIFQLIQACAS